MGDLANGHAVKAAAVVTAAAVITAASLRCCQKRLLTQRTDTEAPLTDEAHLAELFEAVKKHSKGVCYIVSNKTNTEFSASNLISYLKQKKIEHRSGSEVADIVFN